MKMMPYLIKVLFWFSFLSFLNGCSFAPREGVFTQITRVKVGDIGFGSNDGYYHGTVTNNTVTQTIAQAHDYVINHGGIGIGGDFTVYTAHYCCLNLSGSFNFIKIFKRDNIPVNSSIQYVKLAPSQLFQPVEDMSFSFNVTFDDPNITMPESHVYTLEFWECMGECKPDEYDKKTDKKAEIVIYYSVVP